MTRAKKPATKKPRARVAKPDVPDEIFLGDPEPPPSKPKKSPRRSRTARSPARAPSGGRLQGLSPRARIALAVVGAVLALFAITFGAFVFMPGPGAGKLVEMEWPKDGTSGTAATKLSDAGLINSPWMFRVYLALAGGVDTVKPGVHLLSDDMSPRTLLRRLRRTPGGATVRVVIPEGYNKFEIARRMHETGVCASRALLSTAGDPSLLQELRLGAGDAEGYLFPATYEFLRNTDPRDVIRRMALESDRRYARLFDQYAAGLADLKATLGFGKHEVIVLASIVEKEAVVDDERPIIASVFLNRLRDPNSRADRKKLQSDPTSRYGCLMQKLASCESPDGKPTSAMVHDPLNLYSTYAHAGLTPGPIANPSEKSVQAVLAPAQTRYMFFVAKGGGRHTFSETFDEHNAAIRNRH